MRRYERVRYIDTDTGEVLVGESAYRRYLESQGITKFSRRGERRTSYEVRDGIEYVATEQEFKVMGIMERLNFDGKKDESKR